MSVHITRGKPLLQKKSPSNMLRLFLYHLEQLTNKSCTKISVQYAWQINALRRLVIFQ